MFPIHSRHIVSAFLIHSNKWINSLQIFLQVSFPTHSKSNLRPHQDMSGMNQEPDSGDLTTSWREDSTLQYLHFILSSAKWHFVFLTCPLRLEILPIALPITRWIF
jgi:hypothetical protein